METQYASADPLIRAMKLEISYGKESATNIALTRSTVRRLFCKRIELTEVYFWKSVYEHLKSKTYLN